MTYTHGHHESVLRSHTWRTAENSSAYLLPHLRPGQRLLDVGCGPGTITSDLALLVAPGEAVGIDAAADVVAHTSGMEVDDGFDALVGRHGNMIEMGIIDPLRVVRSALQNGASVAGLLLTTNTLVAEEQTPWGGSRALMTEFGSLDEGLHQPSPDSSTPQSLGLGPSVG